MEFEVSKNRLAHIFGLPLDGIIAKRLENKKEAHRFVIRRGIIRDVVANTLSLDMRLLLHMIEFLSQNMANLILCLKGS